MTPISLLSEIAVTHPAASRVFHRHRLDYCCGGRRPPRPRPPPRLSITALKAST